MALEIICTDRILEGERIVVPRTSNAYRINSEDRTIIFYHDNPGVVSELNLWKIPEGARQMDFEIQKTHYGGTVIIPRTYDRNSNILKIGNR